jgi:hypothetical protein
VSENVSTAGFREGARDLGAFLKDVFDWEAFAGYRQRPEAFIVGSFINLIRLVRQSRRRGLTRNDFLFSALFLGLLLPLPVLFAVIGSGKLGNETALALVIVGWGVLLALSDHAEFAHWSSRVQFTVFVTLSLAELGAVWASSHLSPHKHPNLSGAVWGVVFAGSLDIGASLVTVVVRLRNGRPFGDQIPGDWARIRARGINPPQPS